MERTVEAWLQRPYWIVDVLPGQVPSNSPGQYFAVEKYYLSPPRLAAIKQRHADLILKLNCYRDMYLDEQTTANSDPEALAQAVLTRRVLLRMDEGMIESAPDELYLTVYGPDEALLALIRALAAGEGLHVWQPKQAAL